MKSLCEFLYWLFFKISVIITRSQVFPNLDKFNSDLIYSVSSIDDFIDRFNNSSSLDSAFYDRASNRYLTRQEIYQKMFGVDSVNKTFMLVNLVDRNFLVNMEENQELLRFFEAADTTDINFYDPDWYALLEVEVSYNSKKYPLRLLMNNESAEKNSTVSDWVIYACKADFLVPSNASSQVRGINPISHQMDFMQLKDAFDTVDTTRSLISRKYSLDHLTLLAYALERKSLSVEKINIVTYVFFQVNNWVFKVNNFNREKLNRGWLISNMEQIDESVKQNYLWDLLFCE